MPSFTDDLQVFLKARGKANGGPMAASTVEETLKVLRRMLRRGFDLAAFVQDRETADHVAETFLAARHDDIAGNREGGSHGYNSYVKAIKALSRWKGYNLQFGYVDWDPPANRALNDDELDALWTFEDPDEEAELRTLALAQYALTIGWDRGEVAPLEERDLAPPSSCEWQPRYVDHKLPLPEGDVGAVFCRVPFKGSWRRWVFSADTLWNPQFPFLQWLIMRPRVQKNPGAIWTTSRGSGGWSTTPSQLSADYLAKILRDMAKATGLVEFNYRRARHTCGTIKHEEGKSVRAIAYDLGHRSWESSFIYTEPRTGYRLRWAKKEQGVMQRVAPSILHTRVRPTTPEVQNYASGPPEWPLEEEEQRARGDSNPRPAD